MSGGSDKNRDSLLVSKIPKSVNKKQDDGNLRYDFTIS